MSIHIWLWFVALMSVTRQNELVFELKLSKSECKLDQYEQIPLRAHLSPTVLEATALERFKYYKNNPGPNKSTAQKSYSVLFQIKRVFKYENRLFNANDDFFGIATSSEQKENSANQSFFYISSQNDLSNDINLNSFFLIENFNQFNDTTSSSSGNQSCNTINVQMNKNYYLFIDGQDISIKLGDRRVFTYPIRVNSINTGRRGRTKRGSMFSSSSASSSSLSSPYDDRFSRSKLALFVKMPIFNLSARPILADNHFIEQNLEKVLCHNCVKEPRLKLKNNYQIAYFNQTVKLECNFFGNPMPVIYWKRHTNKNGYETIDDDFKFTIYYSNEATSVLVINEVKPDDEGYYYCMARDYVNGDLENEVIVKDRLKLVVRRQPNSSNKHTKPMRNYFFGNNEPTSRNQQNRKKSGEHHTSSSSNINNHDRSSKVNKRKNLLNNKKIGKNNKNKLKQQQKQLILNSLSRSQQTSTISTIIKYFTTSPINTQSTLLDKIKEQKRGGGGGDVDTTTASPSIITNVATRTKAEKNYVLCKSVEDSCLNGGICYITNPNLYSDSYLYNQIKIKFCICKEYFEGPNCEIALMKSIIYDRDEIPGDLYPLWQSLANKVKR